MSVTFFKREVNSRPSADDLSGCCWIALMSSSPDTGVKVRNDKEDGIQLDVVEGALVELKCTLNFSTKKRFINVTSIAGVDV